MRIIITCLSALLLCPVALALATCLGEPPSADWSLLTGEPCAPPCWQGLTPGRSQTHEVEAFLAASDQVEGSSLRKERSGCGQVTSWYSPIAYRRPSPKSGGRENFLCTSDATLRVMMIYLVYDLTLDQLLDRYGFPEGYWAKGAGVPERPYIEVNLYYPQLGLMCQLELPIDDVELRPDTRVDRAWYFEPIAVSELDTLDNVMPVPQVRDFWQPWGGYGPVQLNP